MSAKPETILVLDQGTTSSRAILFSADGDILEMRQKELTLHYPQAGWVEQDPMDIWNDSLRAVQGCLDFAREEDLWPKVLGITNQRETTIIWDRKTGEPVYNAIVWQDRRTADTCAELKARGLEEKVAAKTGLLLDPYFSATKIAWILEHVSGVRTRAEAGELAFGTVEAWLLWRLTGGRVHVSDATNASRTMLYNIVRQCWDEELLELFDIPASLLPEVRDNVSDFGMVLEEFFGGVLPIGGMAGDQQAALVGQGCIRPGMVKSTYGTGCFALMNVGSDFRASQNRLLTTVAYRLNGNVTYAVEGSVFIAGAAIQWLRDGLGLIEDAAQSEALALSVQDNGGVYFVPALTGLGAPHWKPDARGMICGLGRETRAAHIVRAALEAQAYQTLDLLGAMEEDGGCAIDVLRIDGGLAANDFMCGFLADMTRRSVEVPHVHETTAWGAAVLAGVQARVFKDLDDAASRYKTARRYEPTMDAERRDSLYQGWQSCVEKLL
ncbi:MAG: glycerol kinase GlpK [Alphaproteobacteria bacterium]|nr:glycerol kinase GlpK [Alphaproteobacteria bacterium]